jgi:hypothetical protein
MTMVMTVETVMVMVHVLYESIVFRKYHGMKAMRIKEKVKIVYIPNNSQR